MPKVHVQLKDCPYEVTIEAGLLDRIGALLSALGLGSACAIITDHNVASYYLERVTTQLQKHYKKVSTHCISPGEASKSLAHVEQLCRELTQAGHDRSSFVLALGGGVVGDLAGFVASVFFRSVPFVQVPTTIVSQVDSSVGGKTGVNLLEGKNLVGTFYQPKAVFIDPLVLKTLPERDYREGFAEIIKHAAIRDAAMLREIVQSSPSQVPPCESLLSRNIAIKANIVQEDERELSGTRALLNFGHTIGHGIEAAVPYGTLLHGEAISLGIRAALFLSSRHAGLDPAQAQLVHQALDRYELPLVLPRHIATAQILEKLSTDKKFAAGKIRFVLLKELGKAYLSSEVTLEDLETAIEHLRTPL